MQVSGRRKLGSQGLDVPTIGLGCMGMSWAYGEANDTESLKVLHRSVELGINFWDTAEIYGPFKNEELLGKALKEIGRDKVAIATKFGWEFGVNGQRTDLNSSAAHIKKTVEGSLTRTPFIRFRFYKVNTRSGREVSKTKFFQHFENYKLVLSRTAQWGVDF